MPSASSFVPRPAYSGQMESPPRVAFFPDAFDEVNGVAAIARRYTAWAARAGRPMLCVHAGPRRGFSRHGSLERLELPRGFAAIPIEKDLHYDPLWLRHWGAAEEVLRRFRPDVVHVTGPSDAGLLGALLARKLGVPLVASWHTNLHQYAVDRAGWLLRRLPEGSRRAAAARIEQAALAGALQLYRAARFTFAPTEELCAMLRARTGKPCVLCPPGVDAELFHPAKRTAPSPEVSRTYTLGFVGRLSVEKNIAALPRIAREVRERGFGNVCFLVVGQGGEEASLRFALPNGDFAGVLRGPALAEAFANMDCFVFPSETDTFGMVVLEALCSGVPALVTPFGGPAQIVGASGGGGVVAGVDEFGAVLADLLPDTKRRRAMALAARLHGERESWDAAFARMERAYEELGAKSGTAR